MRSYVRSCRTPERLRHTARRLPEPCARTNYKATEGGVSEDVEPVLALRFCAIELAIPRCLQFKQLGVSPALLQQLLVRSTGFNHAIRQHQDAIRHAHTRKAM